MKVTKMSNDVTTTTRPDGIRFRDFGRWVWARRVVFLSAALLAAAVGQLVVGYLQPATRPMVLHPDLISSCSGAPHVDNDGPVVSAWRSTGFRALLIGGGLLLLITCALGAVRSESRWRRWATYGAMALGATAVLGAQLWVNPYALYLGFDAGWEVGLRFCTVTCAVGILIVVQRPRWLAARAAAGLSVVLLAALLLWPRDATPAPFDLYLPQPMSGAGRSDIGLSASNDVVPLVRMWRSLAPSRRIMADARQRVDELPSSGAWDWEARYYLSFARFFEAQHLRVLGYLAVLLLLPFVAWASLRPGSKGWRLPVLSAGMVATFCATVVWWPAAYVTMPQVLVGAFAHLLAVPILAWAMASVPHAAVSRRP